MLHDIWLHALEPFPSPSYELFKLDSHEPR